MEALCRSMEANSSIYAIAMNIPYIDIIRYWIILISNRFLCSDFLHAIMLFSLFYSFHAIYVIFIEAGRFLYPGHEVGQFDDEKRDQMDMAHLACLSWKAGCLWHLFLDLARGVSWKCTVNFVRDGWFHQSSFWFLDKDEPVGTFWDDYFGNIISRNTIEKVVISHWTGLVLVRTTTVDQPRAAARTALGQGSSVRGKFIEACRTDSVWIYNLLTLFGPSKILTFLVYLPHKYGLMVTSALEM